MTTSWPRSSAAEVSGSLTPAAFVCIGTRFLFYQH
jgi:hypothetical protein